MNVHTAGPSPHSRPHPVHGRIQYSALDLVAILNRGRPAGDRIDPPTQEQIEIIEGPLEPTVVIAGAGSGKTTVIGQRVLFLVANGLAEAESILGLTFTRKAVAELAGRIRTNLREFRLKTGQATRPDALIGLDVPTVQTYNSYAAGLVAEYGMSIGIEDDTTVLDEASAIRLAGTVVDSATTRQVPDGTSRTALITNIRQLSGQMDEHLVTPEALTGYIYSCYATFFAEQDLSAAVKRKRIDKTAKADFAARLDAGLAASAAQRHRGRAQLDALVDLVCEFDASDVITRLREKQLIANLVAGYREAKRAHSAMEFSDQVAFAQTIMLRDSQALAAERARWSIVLLDEYQDTSDTQVRLLRRLFSGLAVTAVGDPRQAIYGWRGASAGNISEFGHQFMIDGSRPANERNLSISWRNPKRVLRAANAIAAQIAGTSPGSELRAPDEPDSAGHPGPLQAWKDGSVTPCLTTGAVEPNLGSDLMAGMVGWLAKCAGSRAVLCRKSSQMFEAAAALRAAGLEVHLVGSAGALDDPFVADVVAALTVIADPTAGGEAMRLLTGRCARLGPADIAAFERLRRSRNTRLEELYPDAAEAAQLGIVEVLDELCEPVAEQTTLRADLDASGLSGAARRRIARLARRLRRLRQLHLPVPALLREIARVLGIDAEVSALGPARAEPHRIALDVFVSAATSRLAQEPGTDAVEFLDWLTVAAQNSGLDAPDEAIDKDSGAVIVMTIHKSKGLEFDNVAIPHLTEGDLPGKPRSSLGWLSAGELPYPLRGDRASFPDLDLATNSFRTTKDLKEQYADALAAHYEAEERRLAYVAVTRAQRNLWLGAATFTTRQRPNALSAYLLEAGAALGWEELELPGADDGPPERHESYVWPPPADEERLAFRAGKLRRLRQAPVPSLHELAAVDAATPGRLARVASDLLADTAADANTRLPQRMSATAAVALTEDREAFTAELARPMPHGPVPAAALGTAFHTWVENYFGQATLQDFDDAESKRGLPAALAGRFNRLKETFLASEFAERTPLAVEQPFELRLGTGDTAVQVPGKIDAIFAAGDGIEIVDWKTGHSTAGAELRAKSVQLSVYALAVAQMDRFAGVPVSAAFFYLADDTVLRPERLLTAAELHEALTA